MKRKILFTWPSFIISLIAILCFSIIILFGGSFGQWANIKALSTLSTSKILSSIPIRLMIPMLKINTPIKSLGLTSGGAMETTKGADDVAWFNLGPRPGEKWSAVIAGHYGIWKNGDISVFNKLNTLRKGERISVTDNKGVTIFFRVRTSKIYKMNADATAVFSSTDGEAHLNLITCVFDKVSKTYPKRLVVFTDKE